MKLYLCPMFKDNLTEQLFASRHVQQNLAALLPTEFSSTPTRQELRWTACWVLTPWYTSSCHQVMYLLWLTIVSIWIGLKQNKTTSLTTYFFWSLWRYCQWSTEAVQRLAGFRPLPERQFLQVNALPKRAGHRQGPGRPGPRWGPRAGTAARGDSLQKNGEENHLMFIGWNFTSFHVCWRLNTKTFLGEVCSVRDLRPCLMCCYTLVLYKNLKLLPKRDIMWKLTLEPNELKF